jgi:hypothetical protein
MTRALGNYKGYIAFDDKKSTQSLTINMIEDGHEITLKFKEYPSDNRKHAEQEFEHWVFRSQS